MVELGPTYVAEFGKCLFSLRWFLTALRHVLDHLCQQCANHCLTHVACHLAYIVLAEILCYIFVYHDQLFL